VHFTADDLARTRFCPAPAPLMEAGLALQQLRRSAARMRRRVPGHRGPECPRGAACPSGPAQPTRPRRGPPLIQARWAFPAAARPLLDLVPATGLGPQFIDPMVTALDEGLEIVRATSRPVLRTDLALSWQTRQDRSNRPPGWLRGLADGDREALEIVVRALRAFYAACVAPYWAGVLATFRADVATRIPVLVEGGQAELFAGLHPGLAWHDQALEKAGPASDVWLGGHGVQLMPSAFLTGPPVFGIRPPELGGNALIYPAHPAGSLAAAGRDALAGSERAAPGAAAGSGGVASLAVLLGHTRAAVLRALQEPCGTAELAARLGISAASASEHAKVLRDADLVETVRRGRAVRHSLTYLGHSLLGSYALTSAAEP
jgi:DNA-binding transcriptional ArsR family regulator